FLTLLSFYFHLCPACKIDSHINPIGSIRPFFNCNRLDLYQFFIPFHFLSGQLQIQRVCFHIHPFRIIIRFIAPHFFSFAIIPVLPSHISTVPGSCQFIRTIFHLP